VNPPHEIPVGLLDRRRRLRPAAIYDTEPMGFTLGDAVLWRMRRISNRSELPRRWCGRIRRDRAITAELERRKTSSFEPV